MRTHIKRNRSIRVSVAHIKPCEDSRPLGKRLYDMIYNGIPLTENTNPVHDFLNNEDSPDNFDVDPMHNPRLDVFDRVSIMGHGFGGSETPSNSDVSLDSDPTPSPDTTPDE